MLLNAQNGFEVGTEIQARYARRHEKPVIAAVNQLDAEKANWEQTIEELRANSEAPIVVVQYPVNPGPGFDAFVDVLMMKMYRFKGDSGEREELPIPDEEMERARELNKALVEAAAENDEALMELYFEKGTLTQDEMRSGIKLGLAKRDLVPVFCLSGRRDIGVKRLMEFIINVAPGPLKAPNFRLIGGGDVQADAGGPVSIFVFKTAVEPHLGEVAFFRVISGTLTEGMELTNMATGNKEKIGQIFVSAGRNRVKVTELCAGDIVDYSRVEAVVWEAAKRFDIRALGVDPAMAWTLTSRLMEPGGGRKGLDVLTIPQNMLTLSPAMKKLERLLRAREMLHEHNTCARWSFGNVRCTVDGNENIKPMKNRSVGRIDVPVAWIIAMATAMNREGAGRDLREALESGRFSL